MSARRRTRRIPGLALPLLDRDAPVLVAIDLQPRLFDDRLGAALAYRRSFMPSWVATKPSLL